MYMIIYFEEIFHSVPSNILAYTIIKFRHLPPPKEPYSRTYIVNF